MTRILDWDGCLNVRDLGGVPVEQTVWMSHGDSVAEAPDGFRVLASSESTPVAAFASSA